MTALRLIPRATRIEGGRWRPEVLIAHASGDQSVFCGHTAASHDAALALAQRLAAAASTQEPVTMEVVPPAWR
jgi:hypothetical protein